MNLLNQQVWHKTLGIGTVVAQDDKYITVEFASKTSKFVYPGQDTFVKFLQAKDPVIQQAILQEIEDKKQAAEAARIAAEEAKRKAEEERRRAEEEACAAEQARLEAEAAARRRSKTTSPVRTAAPKTERIPGKPLTFYVFQGDTFDLECRGGFIWAPQHNQSGRKVFHWENMTLVKKGDIILHGCNARVVAVSVAVSDCYDCDRPKERAFEEAWNNEGRRVDLKYYVFQNPIKTSDYIPEILEYCRVKYSPFDRDGSGNMGYLYELNRELAKVFLREAVKVNPGIGEVDVVHELLDEPGN